MNTVNRQLTFDTQFKSLLLGANLVLIISVILFVLSILISYPFAEYFSMLTQTFSHISTIIVAAILKVGYVVRCIAQHGLGQEVR
ncbi:hypothetical protein [Alteromonas sp. M12]|uniref:hypothetical protein n=1 Tax=Alteromonas sp. M12 TaxID=3135644 RepID=UPI00319D9E6F